MSTPPTTRHTGPPLDAFESRLLAELTDVVQTRAAAGITASSPAQAGIPKHRTRVRMALVAAAAALVIGGGIGISGITAQPAFAVTTTPHGDIVVTVNEFTDADALEKALAAEGVKAKVDYSAGSSPVVSVSTDGGTESITVTGNVEGACERAGVVYISSASEPSRTITIPRDTIRSGDTVRIGSLILKNGTRVLSATATSADNC